MFAFVTPFRWTKCFREGTMIIQRNSEVLTNDNTVEKMWIKTKKYILIFQILIKIIFPHADLMFIVWFLVVYISNSTYTCMFSPSYKRKLSIIKKVYTELLKDRFWIKLNDLALCRLTHMA